MTNPMEPYTTNEAIIAANGLVAAYLDWAKAKDDEDRRERYAQMTAEAAEAHDLGALLMGLTHVASAAVTALAAKTPGGEEAVLHVVAASTLREETP